LQPKYDVAGQPITKKGDILQRAFDAYINPINYNKDANDVTLDELLRLKQVTDDNEQLLPLPSKTKMGEKGKFVKLSEEERADYSRLLGQTIKARYDAAIQTEFYQNLPDDYKVDFLAKIKRETKKSIDSYMFGRKLKEKRKKLPKISKKRAEDLFTQYGIQQ